MSSPVVFIDGDQGTTGLQIHERLRNRTDLRLFTLAAAERKDPRRRAEAINACDIAILCLPDAAAREAVDAIVNPAVRVIDASSAHRTQPDWTYGFPEMALGQAERIANARRVTNPGCYPTGCRLACCVPWCRLDSYRGNYPISIHAVSGYSGRGRAGVEEHEGQGAVNAPSFQVYGLELVHKHTPGDPAARRARAALHLRPCVWRVPPGYRADGALGVAAAGTRRGWRHVTHASHATMPRAAHVRVLPLHESCALKHLDPQVLNGTNDMRLSVFPNMEHGHVLLSAVFDNLGKGASGAAVQNLNLMLTQQ
ncbi:N-acetyl-gamma-glutamyl-phosphate reductase [Cupriavidus basilensis]